VRNSWGGDPGDGDQVKSTVASEFGVWKATLGMCDAGRRNPGTGSFNLPSSLHALCSRWTLQWPLMPVAKVSELPPAGQVT
jgi:hypothetical protein